MPKRRTIQEKSKNTSGRRRKPSVPVVLPLEHSQRADPHVTSLQYMATKTGVPSVSLATALVRLITRDGPFSLPQEHSDEYGCAVQKITVAELADAAAQQSAEIQWFRTEYRAWLRELTKAATSDESGVVLLLELATEVIRALESIAERKPEFLGDIAAKYEVWPVLATPFDHQFEKLSAQLSELGVGTHVDTPFDLAKLSEKTRVKDKKASERKLHTYLQAIADDHVIGGVGWIEKQRQNVRKLRRREVSEPTDESVAGDWRARFSGSLPLGLTWEVFDSLPDLDQSEESQHAWYSVLKIYLEHNRSQTADWDRSLKALGKSGGDKGAAKNTNDPQKSSHKWNTVLDRVRRTLKQVAKPVKPN